MVGSAASKRRSRSQMEDEHEADNARFGDVDASSPAGPDGSKRMRLRGGRGGRGGPSHLEMEDDEDEPQESGDDFHSFAGTETPQTQVNGHATSAGGASAAEFAPGAIIRVMVENFVTYEKAEFFPGPNLNMVIGPNGTGKSSLVCAICLGLGYPASTLGRATSFGEFVKHGKEHAIVEIELQKRPQDRANYVFKLKINREDNTRQFWLNGKSCRHSDVKLRMQKLRIQIDNLCQFLPQDKVAEFAGLNSVDLLNRTLQAAAPEEVITQQGQLKEMFDRQKELQRGLETELENLRSLNTRQQGLQADVERLREREQIQQAVADLKDARLIVDYNEKKALFEQVKQQRKRAQQQLKRLDQLSAPSLEDVHQKDEYASKIAAAMRARRLQAVEAENQATQALEATQEVQADIENLETERTAELDSISAKKQALSTQRAKITNLEGRYKNGKDIETKFNPAEWNHKIRECEHRLQNEFKEKTQEYATTLNGLMDQGRAKNTEIKSIEREIQNLDSQEGQRFAQLRRNDPEVARAYEWLQEHQSDFQKEVFGPPMLSCSVKDKRYSNHVQMGLQKDDFFCFIAQTKDDHRKLTDQLFRKMKLAVTIRTILTDLSTFRPPVPRDGLRNLGLDGYAVDFLEGPDPVLAMLCSEKKLHLTGVALKEISDEQYQMINDGEKINSFSTGATYHRTMRRREYGAGATSTMTSTIRPGRFWTDETVDAGAKAECEQRRKECLREKQELKQQFDEIKAQQTEISNKEKDVEQELEKLRADKKEIQREYSQWKALPDKIDVEKKALQALRDGFEEARQSLSSYDGKFDKLALKKAKLVLQYQARLSAIREANEALLEAQTRHIEAVSDLELLKLRSEDVMRRLEDEKKKVEELVDQENQVKTQAQGAKSLVQNLLANSDGDLDPERRDFLVKLCEGKTLDAINEDIETENAKLDLIHQADPGVLRDFEKRAKEIERLQAENDSRRAALEELDEGIRGLRRTWEPALDEIIRRINDAFSFNFEQINCAGEVGVHKDEDFDKWAIEVKVKFRENETLQKLDQHRQSGGERAVSTIFYLMSLQSMAQAPFRVVDEINQGMDPRNERMVHERMVEIACKEHTSQYFLITPKLLPNLKYDEHMKVMCIASGEHMPAEGRKLDFGRCVKIKKRLRAAASA